MDDRSGTALGRRSLPRRVSYALAGACVAQGAAAGLVLLRLIARHQLSLSQVTPEIASDLGTYLYIALSTTVVFSLFGGLVGGYVDELVEAATTDSLTGLLNRRAFHHRCHEEIVRATRYRQPLSLLIVDLDGLKRINDEYGHQAGDEALRRVAWAIRDGLREADLGARVGGDEFTILAPNTDEAAATVFGERLGAMVREGNAGAAQRGTTVSIGIASVGPSDRDTSQLSLMRAADAALYRAKREGGNCVAASSQVSADPAIDSTRLPDVRHWRSHA